MSSVQVKNICGLSPVQEGMYFHYLMSRPNDPYVIQSYYALVGEVDPDRLKSAFNTLVERHDALRTLFMHQKTPDPVQIILQKREIPFEYHDIRSEKEADSFISEYMRHDREKGFDLSRDPLVRLVLFRLDDRHYRLVLTLHHIILDGWSSGVIEHELFHVYAGEPFASKVTEHTPVSFAEYIKWLKNQSPKLGIDYFRNLIPQDLNFGPFTSAFAELQNNDIGVHTSIAQIDPITTAELKALATEQQVSLSDVLRVAWYLTTAKLTGVERFTTLHTVSGRPSELMGASNMVGMFINAIVQPAEIQDVTITEFMRQHHRQFAECMTWQHSSMSDVAKAMGVHAELADCLLVFENYPELGDERLVLEQAMGFAFTSLNSQETTNYPVTIQFHIGSTIEVRYFLKSNRFQQRDLQLFERTFEQVCTDMVVDPLQSVQAFSSVTSPLSTSQAIPVDPIRVYLSSNFTDNTIVPYLNRWLDSAGFSPTVDLADYNTILQGISNPESLFFEHQGPKVVLLKILDLARFRNELSGEALESYLSDTLTLFVNALRMHPGNDPICVFLTPEQPERIQMITDSAFQGLVSLTEQLLSELDHVKLVDIRKCHLSPADLFDETTDLIGHMPYTDAGYSFLASQVARTLRAWKYQPFKVIVLDADNTLWQGVLGEDGVDGIQLTDAHRMLQSFMLERKNNGFLLALCTKNNPTDIDELFATRSDMILKSSDFVSIKANWSPKSGNIQDIAIELNLGIDSLIFLDDSALEIEEVSRELPDVMALKLPELLSQWDLFLNHIWAFDTFNVTTEDRKRTELYLAESKRREIAQKHVGTDDFIQQLGVKTEFFHANESILPRIEQLTQRTNQFNLNGRRFTLAEVRSYLEQANHHVVALSVSDQFGEYGITGSLFFRVILNVVHIDAWMLSCRVLARGVEDHVVRFLSDMASEYGADTLIFHHQITAKNLPLQQFLSNASFRAQLPDESGMEMVKWSVDDLHAVPNSGTYSVVETLTSAANIPSATQKNRSIQPPTDNAAPTPSVNYSHLPSLAINAMAHLRNRRYLCAINRLHPEELNQFKDLTKLDTDSLRTPYEEPVTSTEHRIAAIWSALLDENHVGRNDDFFLLGGNSLMATRLASRIYTEFKKDVELRTLFENSVLHELAAMLDQDNRLITTTQQEDIPVISADHYPLSDSQLRIWRSEQVFDSGSGYLLGGAYRILGEFDIDRLTSAVQLLVNKHESLRTTFPLIDDTPRQVIHDSISIPINVFGEITDGHTISETIERFFETRFDLEAGPLMALGYLRESDHSHVLAIKIHHLITDGWSQGIIMQQLVDGYQGGTEHLHLIGTASARFVDFVHWQQHQSTLKQTEWKSFWQRELSQPYERIQLPYDFPRPLVIKKSTRQLSIPVDASLHTRIDAFARKNQLSLYMTMMASVQLLLQRYTASSDVIVGSPFSGRTHPSVQDTVGFFVNTLPFRMQSGMDTSVGSWIQELREKTVQMLEFQHVSLDTIINYVQIPIVDQRPPLFDVLMLVQEESASDDSTTSGFTINPIDSEYLGAGYDLVFHIFSSRKGWRLVIEYQPELFHPRTIGAMGEHWKAILHQLSASSESTLLREISVNTPEIHERLIRMGRGAQRVFADQTLLEVFESAMQRDPNAIALIDEATTEISYSQLDIQTTHLASALYNHGVRPGDRVVVNTELKSNAIKLMIALFKCRAVYVPVDSETPASRIDYIMETCDPICRITDTIKETHPVAQPDVQIFTILQLISESTFHDRVTLPEPGNPGDSAYIIFTSGSTGRPKGVEVHHRGLVNMAHNLARLCDVNESDRVFCFASISFDASLSEFFMAFCYAATLVCADNAIKKDAQEFIDHMNRLRISVIILPPVYLASLNRPELPFLKSMVTAGEAARKTDALHYATYKRYINAYGPTECSVGSNAHLVSTNTTYPSVIPIGTAFDNVQLAVLDSNLKLAPFGATGQLAINGLQVAKGYIGRPDLTEKVFIDHPYFDGKTYLTGDQVRWNANGQLEFVGRNDNQVKVRGYRIELDEIKHQMESIASVAVSHVHVATDANDDKQIIAWLVEESPITDEELRNQLSRVLQAYMIPSRFIRVPEIKLSINGKVDIASLPDPLDQGSTIAILPLVDGSLELKLLHTALVKYLVGAVDLTTTFTKTGGDSIKAIQISNYLKQHGYPVRAGQLYEVSRLDELADHMVQVQAQASGKPKITIGEGLCTPMQQWFFHEIADSEQRNLFWMQAGFTLDEELTQDFVHQMIEELVSHHEIFRLRFPSDPNLSRVVVGSEPMVNVQLLDGNAPDFQEQFTLYHDTLNRRIDLNNGPLAAFLIVHRQGSTQLLCTIHHLVMDAMSIRLMRDQFQWMLEQHRKGESITLQSGYITQQQWTERCTQIRREAGFDSEREHWDSMFAAMTQNPEVISAGGETRVHTLSISIAQSAVILDLCKSAGQKLEHLLIASGAKAIATVTGMQGITVGIETQGRESLGKSMDTGTTLGWFTTEYPVYLSCSCTLSELVSEVKAQISGIQRDGLGAVLARNQWIERGLIFPKSDLGFNYLGQFDSITSTNREWRWDDSLISTESDFTHQWHPMEFSALVENGAIQLRFQSNYPKMNQYELELILETIQADLIAMAQTEAQDNRPTIVFFPFVASNAGFFDNLKEQLESDYKIVVLELPGHGKRLDDPFAESLEQACNDLLGQIQRTVTRTNPMFWVGHSMGAYVASACLSVLQTRQQQLPVGLIISDVAAPGQFDTWIVGDMTPAQRSEYYSRLGYDVLLKGLDEVSKNYAEQLIRKDLKLVRNFVDPNQPRITLPVHFLYSTSDSESVKDHWVAGWQSICDHTIQSTAFEGGHIDWLGNSRNSEVIKAWIRSIF